MSYLSEIFWMVYILQGVGEHTNSSSVWEPSFPTCRQYRGLGGKDNSIWCTEKGQWKVALYHKYSKYPCLLSCSSIVHTHQKEEMTHPGKVSLKICWTSRCKLLSQSRGWHWKSDSESPLAAAKEQQHQCYPLVRKENDQGVPCLPSQATCQTEAQEIQHLHGLSSHQCYLRLDRQYIEAVE